MNRRPIPRTQHWVSILYVGTMNFRAPVIAGAAIRLVQWAIGHGIHPPSTGAACAVNRHFD